MPGTGSFSANSKVQKQRGQRSQFNLSNSTVQKVISGDPDALARLANLGPEKAVGSVSDSSSQPPSTTSSNSTTPKIDAIGSASNYTDITNPLITPTDITEASQWPLNRSDPRTASSMISGERVAGKPTKSCCCGDDSSSNTLDSQMPSTVVQHNSSLQSPMIQPQSQPPVHSLFDAYNQPYGIQNGPQFPELDTDFSTYELSVGCDGMHGASLNTQSAHKDCNCGDTCACFACATHPNNRTTIDYVRYHNELFMRREYEQITHYLQSHPSPQSYAPFQQYNPAHQTVFNHIQQSFASLPGQSQNLKQSYSYQRLDWSQPSTPTLQSNPSTNSSIKVMHFTPEPHPFTHQTQIPIYDNNMSLLPEPSYRPLQTIPHQPIAPETPHGRIIEALDNADSPDDSSTLSPSSFLLQQFSLPDCSNVNGTCLCGDGCSCPGCLTHSGHDVEQTSSNDDGEVSSCCGGGTGDE
jgi:hypothetical protein